MAFLIFQAHLQETTLIVDDYFAYILAMCFLAVCFWMQFSPTHLMKNLILSEKENVFLLQRNLSVSDELLVGFFQVQDKFPS